MTLTIGEVARGADVNVQTVRYYERRGLVPEPPRTASGYRQYGPEAIARIQFIKGAQALGFSLAEIAELLDLRVHPRRSCSEVRSRAEEKLIEIDRRIGSLERLKAALDRLIDACDSNTPTNECPILESLEP